MSGTGRLADRRILVVGAGTRTTELPSTEIPGTQTAKESADGLQNDPLPVGNGRAIALSAAREGAAVICADRSESAAAGTAGTAPPGRSRRVWCFCSPTTRATSPARPSRSMAG
jgi:hypothetical protein